MKSNKIVEKREENNVGIIYLVKKKMMKGLKGRLSLITLIRRPLRKKWRGCLVSSAYTRK